MKTVLHRRLHDGQVGFSKKLRRMQQATAVDVFHTGHSCITAKKAHEMSAAEVAEPGQLVNGEVFCIMRLDMGQDLLPAAVFSFPVT